MAYVHPDDKNLSNLHKAMGLDILYRPMVRTSIVNDPSNPIPVSLNGNDVVITGNVTIPGTVNVASNPSDPVHVHVSEVGTSGILTVPWMPIAGNVTVDGGNINVVVKSGNVTVQQGTTPWVTTVSNGVAVGSLPETAITAFEEPLAVQITPVLQADGVYGLDPDFWTTTQLNGGNITTTQDSTWLVQSGTSPGGYARLATSRYMTYQPGQGSMFRWTAGFTTNGTTKDAFGVDSIVQTTGPIDREDGYAFGYSGATDSDAHRKLGILHRRGGRTEVRQLAVTVAPTGNQTATITLNNVVYTANLTAGGSTAYTAAQIASQLKANTVANNTWDIEAYGSTVQFTYYSPGPKNGSYSFSSTGTGTLAEGTFSQLVAGVTPTDVWTYVDSWDNQNIQFDPSKLNVFAVDLRWLGAGKVRFFMENPVTGNMELIHTQIWSSQYQVPHITKPSLRLVYRSGTTSGATPGQNVIVRGASIFAGIQGIVTQTGSSQGWYHVDATSRAKDTVWHLMSLQNPFVRNQNSVNKASIILQNLTVSVQGQDPSLIYLIKNCVGTSDLLVFGPIPVPNPFVFAQYSTTLVSENLSLDTLANIQTLGINGNSSFDLMAYNLALSPGETISVFISSSGSITKSTIGLTWKID